jgi:hypothetical protein
MTDLSRQARLFEAAAVVALVLLALNLLRLIGVVPLAFGVAEALGAGDPSAAWPAAEAFLIAAVSLLPTIIYIGGVDSARKMFRRIGAGELFTEANSKSLADIGAALGYGALAAMVIVPWLQSWIGGERGFGGVRIEGETLVIAVIGGALLVLGRMLSRARRLQSELDSII